MSFWHERNPCLGGVLEKLWSRMLTVLNLIGPVGLMPTLLPVSGGWSHMSTPCYILMWAAFQLLPYNQVAGTSILWKSKISLHICSDMPMQSRFSQTWQGIKPTSSFQCHQRICQFLVFEIYSCSFGKTKFFCTGMSFLLKRKKKQKQNKNKNKKTDLLFRLKPSIFNLNLFDDTFVKILSHVVCGISLIIAFLVKPSNDVTNTLCTIHPVLFHKVMIIFFFIFDRRMDTSWCWQVTTNCSCLKQLATL